MDITFGKIKLNTHSLPWIYTSTPPYVSLLSCLKIESRSGGLIIKRRTEFGDFRQKDETALTLVTGTEQELNL
jgi:hypothetical protein